MAAAAKCFSDEYFTDARDLIVELTRAIVQQMEHDKTEVISESAKQLIGPLCKLVSIVVPDVRNKLAEHLAAYENDKLSVLSSAQGPDLVDASGCFIEHKSAKWRANKNDGKVSIMFSFKRDSSIPASEKARQNAYMVEQFRSKVANNGHVLVTISDYRGDVIFENRINGAFMADYFASLDDLCESENVNIGCKRCDSCGSFHRIQRFVEYSQRYVSNGNRLETADWDVIKSRIKSDCGEKPADP